MSKNNAKSRSGSCLCGLVKFVVDNDPVIVAHCHCSDCQKQSGAGHTTGAMFLKSNLKLSGNIKVHKLKSDNGNEVSRYFCPECGSLIYSNNDKLQDHITIPLGVFEYSDCFTPEVTIYSRNCQAWDDVDQSTHSFDTQPEWTPDR